VSVRVEVGSRPGKALAGHLHVSDSCGDECAPPRYLATLTSTGGLETEQDRLAGFVNTQEIGFDCAPITLVTELDNPVIEDGPDQSLTGRELGEGTRRLWRGLLLRQCAPLGNKPSR
jgi:hypothetical protein